MLVIVVVVISSGMKPSVRMPNCSGVGLVINWVLVKRMSFSVTAGHTHNSYHKI